jgi:rare lipoprotein A
MHHRSFTLFAYVAAAAAAISFTGCSSKETPKYSHTKFTSAARHKATMRCYTVLGRTYRPTYVKVGETMTGIASWYGPNFHGKQTSNGERYDMHAKTAAHKTWPMDTMVKVTNLQNGRSTIVRINDRGPFVKGRIIDCSYAAGKALGLDKMGIAKVKIEVVGFAGKVESPQKIAKAKATKSEPRVKLSNFGIQVGAYTHYEGALKTKRKYQQRSGGKYRVLIKEAQRDGERIYRVLLMGFPSEKAAKDYRECEGLQYATIIRN